MSQILVVEDSARIASFVAKGLRAAGYAPTVVGTARDAVEHALSGAYDLMVLDLGLPDGDGMDVAATVRAQGSAMAIIILTARDSVTDTVAGLEGGADDYMPKPFRFEELLARVKLRAREAASGAGSASTDVLELGDLVLDLRTRIATWSAEGKERSVELSSREFTMARVFLENPHQVLTRDLLLSKVWGYDYDGASNVVDVYVGYLRTKLGAKRLVTVRGAGYKMVDPVA